MTSHKRTNSEYIDYVGLAAPQLSQKGTTSESLTGGGAPLPGGRESAGNSPSNPTKISKTNLLQACEALRLAHLQLQSWNAECVRSLEAYRQRLRDKQHD